MSTQEASKQWTTSFKESLVNGSFIKLTFGNYQGDEKELKNIYARKISIKGNDHLSFTYRYKTRDITKNFDLETSKLIIQKFLDTDFKVANLMTIESDFQFERLANGKQVLRVLPASQQAIKPTSHDRDKHRHISAEKKSYLTDLKITSSEGNVLKDAQDKFKQINHYIDLMRVMLENLNKKETLHVLDMGSGKGYLTFALFDYLTSTLKLNVNMIGVEYRQDMVDLCNEIASKNEFTQLEFVQGRIEDFKSENIDVLIALHACDTATDDAIFKGIQHQADLIVVAPCCHKQIRREIEKSKAKTPIDSIIRHGIYLEREAEMITDSLRALLLEYAGYKVKVVEFIAAAHTPKNVMIIAEKSQAKNQRKELVLAQINELKSVFGIQCHYLETLMSIPS